MARSNRGNVPVIDHSRITRATDPRLRGPVPALSIPIEGANPVLDKPGVTLNRGGSSPRNPILAGLGFRHTAILNSSDRMKSIHVFKDGNPNGPNLIAQAGSSPGGVNTFDIVAGTGRTATGTPVTGAVKNFIRWQSSRGIIQKEFYIKTFDFDVVALAGKPALDAITLLKVCIDVVQIDVALSFIDVVIDFMVSWNDEFGALHNANNPHLDPGFLKAYGGSKFVSFFDTSTALEGTGVEVKPVTQTEIKDQHKVQVQNTVGQKNFTVRFRSRKDSPFFVDVDVCVNVLALVCAPGDPPVDDAPVDDPTVFIDYVPPQVPPVTPTDIPETVPGTGNNVPYSIEGIPPEPLPFSLPVTTDLVVLSVQAQTTGSVPTFIVRRYSALLDAGSPGSVKFVLLNEKTYFPIVVAGATKPTRGAPYQAAQMYRIAFQNTQEVVDQVALYVVFLKDGDLMSGGTNLPGPVLINVSPILTQVSAGRLDTTPAV